MAVNTVLSAGAHATQQADGRYHLAFWYRLKGGRIQEEAIDDLSWAELCDCLLTQLDNARPGWGIGDGWRQPALEALDDAL